MGEQMNSAEPFVSIIIPVYNGADYMREAIDSALAQTYKNTEVIVVNDGSADNGKTDEIALSYAGKIRYFKKENGGVSSALNLGIKNMRGEYFSWLSHDDVYKPRKIERQINLLRSVGFKPDTLAMCCADFINGDSEIIRNTKSKTKKTQLLSWQNALYRLIADGCFIGCDLLIPRKAFDDCGMFDENLRYIQDFLMWIKIFANKYRLFCSRDVDVHSRVHGGQLTQKGKALFAEESEKAGRRIIPLFAELSSPEYNFLYRYAVYCAINRLNVNVSECIKTADKNKLFSPGQKAVIRFYELYGKTRPALRKAYYRVLQKKSKEIS